MIRFCDRMIWAAVTSAVMFGCSVPAIAASDVMSGEISTPDIPQLRSPLISDASNPAPIQPVVNTVIKPITCGDSASLNDFQKYLCRTVGVALPVYGRHMFSHGGSTFSPMQAMPVGPEYVLNVGDEFVLRTWGQLDAELTLKVDR